MDKKVIDRMYAAKKAYVERSLAATLQPLQDFGKIEYARDAITNEEYIKLTETIGSVCFIDVTGSKEDAILREVCRMVLDRKAYGRISTKEKMREANALFR